MLSMTFCILPSVKKISVTRYLLQFLAGIFTSETQPKAYNPKVKVKVRGYHAHNESSAYQCLINQSCKLNFLVFDLRELAPADAAATATCSH